VTALSPHKRFQPTVPALRARRAAEARRDYVCSTRPL
jgi:hypothetical protein